MQEIKVEKSIIKTEKLLKRFIKILWQNKLKLFLAFLGVVAITGGVILATGGSFTINKSPKLSLTDGLVGMWSFDGDDIAGTTAYDRSGQGNDGTLTNGPTKTMGKIGQALEFDDNNYVDFGGADLIHESDNWTITVWGKPSVGGSTDGFVGVGGTTGETWTLEMNNDYMRVVVGGGEAQANYTDPSLNEWHHYIFLRNGDDFEAYIDGVYQTKATRAGSLRGSSGGYVERTVIGAGFWNQGVASNFLDGIMDEARVYNRVLSQEEITRLYKMGESKFNVSPELSLTDGLAGYWSFDGEDIYGATAYDRSGQGNDGAITNGPTKTIGKIGQALEFNGENYVNAGDDASLYMDDNFTVSWWMKSALPQKSWGVVLDKGDSGKGYNWNYGCNYYSASDTAFRCIVGNVSTFVTTATSGFTIPIGIWTHVVLRVDATDVSIYKNGVFGNSVGRPAGTLAGSGKELLFGAPVTYNTTYNYNGAVDEVRVYNRALSQAEINRLYKMGESKFNAPQNLKLTDGLVGIWSFNGEDIYGTTAYDRSGQGNNGTITGATKTMGKVGQALEFDGDDYVTMGDVLDFERTDSFSVSAWVKRSVTGAAHTIASKYDKSINRGYMILFDDVNKVEIFLSNDSSPSNRLAVETQNAFTSTTNWYHIVVTYDGSADPTGVHIYMNDNDEDLDTIYDDPLSATTVTGASFNLGSRDDGDSNFFNGSIDEVRVYNRALSADEITRLYNMGK